MCVVNKQLELLEFLVPFMLILSIKRFLSLLLVGLCACVVCVVMWSSLVSLCGCLGTLCGGCGDCACAVACVVCEYDERLRECAGNGNAGVGDGRGMIVVSTGYEYVGGTRGAGIVYSAADVVGINVVRGMRGVVGMCEMCGVGGGWCGRWGGGW